MTVKKHPDELEACERRLIDAERANAQAQSVLHTARAEAERAESDLQIAQIGLSGARETRLEKLRGA